MSYLQQQQDKINHSKQTKQDLEDLRVQLDTVGKFQLNKSSNDAQTMYKNLLESLLKTKEMFIVLEKHLTKHKEFLAECHGTLSKNEAKLALSDDLFNKKDAAIRALDSTAPRRAELKSLMKISLENSTSAISNEQEILNLRVKQKDNTKNLLLIVEGSSQVAELYDIYSDKSEAKLLLEK